MNVKHKKDRAPTTLKQALKNKLPKKLENIIPSSFDVVGDIAVIEIPEELKKYELLIGNVLLSLHSNLKVVCRKHGIHKGKFRTQEYRILAGERRKETVHKENNARIKLHIEKTYFSSRLGTERLRVSKLVKSKENILVMFGGVAPYACVISKNAEPKKIVSVELNPHAHKYAVKNILLNKLKNVEVVQGDVKIIVPKLKGKFDRILMPLPRNAEDYLGQAFKKIKKNGVIHMYNFGLLEETELILEKIKKQATVHKKKYKILNIQKCGQYSPRKFRVCIDFVVLD